MVENTASHKVIRHFVLLLFCLIPYFQTTFAQNEALLSQIENELLNLKCHHHSHPGKTQIDSIPGYTLKLNLESISKGKIEVELEIPPLHQKSATLIIPLSSQAIKSPKIKDFQLLDTEGKPLPFDQEELGTYLIYNADRAKKIKYNLFLTAKSSSIAGTSINTEPEAYIISPSGLFPYVKGLLQNSYTFEVSKPKHLYGATALERRSEENSSTDIFYAPNYLKAYENAILYAEPDTSSFEHKGVKYHIAVHSDTQNISARTLRSPLKKIASSVHSFLGELPLNEYRFNLYFSDDEEILNSSENQYGGWMCAASSFYILPALGDNYQLQPMIQKVGVHEMLHLFTPHLLKSNKTKYYGLVENQNSAHLWLYEGITEYFTLLCLKQNDLLANRSFWKEWGRKLDKASAFPPYSLTQMGKEFSAKKKAHFYPDLYFKGAWIGFALDVLIREAYSNKQSEYPDLFSLLKHQLVQTQGEPFNDDNFLKELKIACAPIKSFVKKHIEGRDPLPYEAILFKTGMRYYDRYIDTIGYYGEFRVYPNFKKNQLVFGYAKENDLGVKPGDILVAINDEPMYAGNFHDFQRLLYQPLPNSIIQVDILRDGIAMQLKEKAPETILRLRHVILANDTAEKEAVEIRNSILKGVKMQRKN